MENKYALVDRTNYPIVKFTFTGNLETEDNFEEYLNELSFNYLRNEPIAVIFDAAKASTPNPKYQLKQAHWLKQNKTIMKEYCRGVAYVIKQPAIRIILELIFKIQKQPCPYKIVSEIEEAKSWVNQQLK